MRHHSRIVILTGPVTCHGVSHKRSGSVVWSRPYISNDASHAASLKSEYTRRRSSYKGFSRSVCDCNFDI